MKWPTARVPEIARLNPPVSSELAENDLVSFVPMSAVEAEGACTQSGEERTFAECAKGYTAFKNGDLLVAKITPCFENGKIAQATIAHTYGFGSTEFHVVRPDAEKTDSRYLLHYLRQPSIRAQGERKMTGSAGQRRVPEHFIASLELPLPPLAEQKRIAGILDQADALRALHRAALAKLDALPQAIFADMFGDPARGPKYPCGPIRPFAEASSGKSAKGYTSQDKTNFPIYGGNGINGWATEPLYEQPVLVFGRVGQQCGNTFITEGPAWVTDNAIVVTLADSAPITPAYLLHAFQLTKFAERVKHLDLPFINQGMILDYAICLPPLALQEEFARRVGAVEQLRSAHRDALTKLDELFAALQHRAFRGEL